MKFTAYMSSVIALALQSSEYLAERSCAGIESIEKGQIEAAQSLGMTPEVLQAMAEPARSFVDIASFRRRLANLRSLQGGVV